MNSILPRLQTTKTGRQGHGVPTGFKRIRHYGLLANPSGKTLFVQHKKGAQSAQEPGLPSQAMGIMKPMAGVRNINPL